jgi:hypothetical protein
MLFVRLDNELDDEKCHQGGRVRACVRVLVLRAVHLTQSPTLEQYAAVTRW